MAKLTAAQERALEKLADAAHDTLGCLIHIGPQWKRTLAVLEAIGFARFFPSGGPKRQGLWKITAEGRKLLAALDAERERSREEDQGEQW